MYPLIIRLTYALVQAVRTLLEFLSVLVLGILAAIAYSIPWALRVSAALIWFAGTYLLMDTIEKIYSPFSPVIPMRALQFAVIILSISWPAVLMNVNAKYIWSGFAISGLTMSGTSLIFNEISAGWNYGNLFFQTLPPILFSVLLIRETVRFRIALRRSSRGIKQKNDRHESDKKFS